VSKKIKIHRYVKNKEVVFASVLVGCDINCIGKGEYYV